MDAIRKQASKLREQVARQQQAVIKQFAGGLGGSEEIVANEVELQQQQKLEKLYISTRSAKAHGNQYLVFGTFNETLFVVSRVSLLPEQNKSKSVLSSLKTAGNMVLRTHAPVVMHYPKQQ
nr:hypothetical protein [Tanacetum cinerariifolium]